MKSFYQRKRMFEIVGRLPGRVVPACPTDEVLKLPKTSTGIEDLFDLEFLLVVDYNGRWRRLNLSLERVRGDRFQKRNMKDRVDFHRRGKL